jgi:hypothetical protein
MGYGSRAIDLLISYFQGELALVSTFIGEFGGEGAEAPKKKKQNKVVH